MLKREPTVCPKLGWRDLFPSYKYPEQIDRRLVTLAELCHRIGLPFPAEPKRPYSTWWRALHEIGHWAVKPPWYIQYSNLLRDDIAIKRGPLHIPAGTIPGVDYSLELGDFHVYGAGNDLIPDIALLCDPTPGEAETRVWCLLEIQRYGWPHPFDENKVGGVAGVTAGDTAFHKAASARVWRKGQLDDPDVARSMAMWGIDPLSGFDRARDDGFQLPFTLPASVEEMVLNMDAVYQNYSPNILSANERQAWIDDYLTPRYSKYFS